MTPSSEAHNAPVGHATFRGRFALAVATGALLVTGCSSAAPATDPAPATVEVGLYSGRPDPSVVLTREQAATLDALLATLPTRTGTPVTGGLGYHGFTLTRPSPGPGSGPTVLVAYRGQVAAPGTGSRELRIDADRNVEVTLLNDVRGALTPDEVAVIEQDLALAG